MQGIRDIFTLWPTNKDFGLDIGAKADTVRKWKKAGRIPQAFWQPVIEAVALHGHTITAADLLAFSAPMKQRGKPAHKPQPRQRKTKVEARAS
jgi:hypothetical protein